MIRDGETYVESGIVNKFRGHCLTTRQAGGKAAAAPVIPAMHSGGARRPVHQPITLVRS